MSSFHTDKYVRACMLAILLVVLASFVVRSEGVVHAEPLITYNCTTNPNTSSGHCYGVNYWGGANGADTRITLNWSTAALGGFVNNEMWLTTSDNAYWVEAGLKSYNYARGFWSNVFFWADNRPNGGGYNEHYSNPVSDNQPNALTRITRSGTSNWNVSVNDGVTSFTGTSTNNNITIGYIEIGMELYGNEGATASKNDFTNNRWLDSNGTFEYQTNNGVGTTINSPVNAGWNVQPIHSSTGGDWFTCISGAGC